MDANNIDNVNIVTATPLRICKCCGKELPITEFNHYTKTSYRWICKSCQENNISENDKFKDITSRELILELRARGYRGKLTKTITKDIVI
jgi:hypothetical protein